MCKTRPMFLQERSVVSDQRMDAEVFLQEHCARIDVVRRALGRT